jgi:serine/threonine protein kinase
MDYVPFNNLSEYMRKKMQSITLRTKLYLIFSIIQALRFIRDQQIVHLDLKPNNIMIYWNLLIKLIDFGESYQIDACLKSIYSI